MTLDQYLKHNGCCGSRTKGALARVVCAWPWSQFPPFDSKDEQAVHGILLTCLEQNKSHIRGLGWKGVMLLAKYFKISVPKKVNSLSSLQRQLSKAKKRIAELERGEFICKKCGLRKNAEKVEADF